ncbi:MAG: RNA-binding protein [Gammaproteobacteria bacterium]|nr:RNA-binding protein [Gammaproteobacteria bacterium]
MNESAKIRIDKWLWAARFYKTRSLATAAIDGGHVRINGERAKPSRTVNIGDELTLRKDVYEFVVVVTGISSQRGPASTAQTLYQETEASQTARVKLAEQRRLDASLNVASAGRPDKRARRKIIRFIRQED